MDLKCLLNKYGELYSKRLKIDVEEEPFKWLVASILFGGRITTKIAEQTYRTYERNGLLSPWQIQKAPRSKLISVHGQGGYARYDGVTSDYMKGIVEKLINEYEGDVKKLDDESRSSEELEVKLLEFRGIGPVTVKIFLRDLRGIWMNADPHPTQVEEDTALRLGFIQGKEDTLRELKDFWEENRVKGYDFRNFETSLVRFGLQVRRKGD